MFRALRITLLAALAVTISSSFAAATPRAEGFVGFHHYFHWLRDADGDGIPNGMDADWTRPMDGTGYQVRNGFAGIGGCPSSPQLNQNGNRRGYRGGDTLGDHLRIMLRLRDGSCTP
jgi:hypothetical protein